MNNQTKDRLYSEYKMTSIYSILCDTENIKRSHDFRDYVNNGGFFNNDLSYYRVKAILSTN